MRGDQNVQTMIGAGGETVLAGGREQDWTPDIQ